MIGGLVRALAGCLRPRRCPLCGSRCGVALPGHLAFEHTPVELAEHAHEATSLPTSVTESLTDLEQPCRWSGSDGRTNERTDVERTHRDLLPHQADARPRVRPEKP